MSDLIRRLLWVALTSALLSKPALALTEKVKPQQMLNYANVLYPVDGGGLTDKVVSDCYANSGGRPVLSCSFTFSGIYWNEQNTGWDKWQWKGVSVQVTQVPGYDAQTITSEIYGSVYNICPSADGFSLSPSTPVCIRTIPVVADCDQCKKKVPDEAKPPGAGNPIYPLGQIKVETKVDYENARGTLRFVRTYRSDTHTWTHNYNVSLVDLKDTTWTHPTDSCYFEKNTSNSGRYCYPYMETATTNDFVLRRGASRPRYFSSSNQYKGDADIRDRVSVVTAGGLAAMTARNGETDAQEIYDASGRILTSTALNGQVTTFEYSAQNTPGNTGAQRGLLMKVTDAFGASLRFTYNFDGSLATMTDPAGGVYSYGYNSHQDLASVTYPDGKRIQYLYESPDDKSALTGINDENGVRYATFTYLGGLPRSTEHAGGVYKYTVEYEYDIQMKVTDPLGTAYGYQHTTILGTKRLTSLIQPGASNRISYDANGNVKSITSLDGKVTNYNYDLIRNIETSRVEAVGTTSERTISTSWHAQFDQPLKIAQPRRITTYTYDDFGNVLTRTVQATTDANGSSGFSAALTGTPQVWTYTYDSFGHVLTAKGPRSDVTATATFTYDAEGNLATQSNAAGHTTSYSNYDPNGRIGRITDPNGLVTDMSYTPRGWLSAISVGGETTSYDYDGVGQLTQTTLPDGSAVYYTYDNAHRLTRIADTQGNSISYMLDNMGNRTSELTKDANGNLTRQITRVMDALNRVQKITGALQ